MAERIKIQKGITLNLGNYQSYRVDVGIEKDVTKYSEKEYAVLDKLVTKKLDAEIDRMRPAEKNKVGDDVEGTG